MKYYHIIEEATDQQTVEVYAETMQEALDIYFRFSTNETATEVITTGNQIVYDFPLRPAPSLSRVSSCSLSSGHTKRDSTKSPNPTRYK